MKNAQLYSQMFIYILTIFLTAIILVYGYNAIDNFRKRADQLSCLKFQNELKNAIESIYSDYGSVKKKDMQACSNYDKICFVESVKQPTIPANIDPLIKDSILSKTGKNVFFLENTAKESYYAGRISVDPDILCLQASNNLISIRIESRGDYALISKWSGS